MDSFSARLRECRISLGLAKHVTIVRFTIGNILCFPLVKANDNPLSYCSIPFFYKIEQCIYQRLGIELNDNLCTN